MKKESKVQIIRKRKGLQHIDLEYGLSGDIITISGFEEGLLNDVLSSAKNPKMPEISEMDPPILFLRI